MRSAHMGGGRAMDADLRKRRIPRPKYVPRRVWPAVEYLLLMGGYKPDPGPFVRNVSGMSMSMPNATVWRDGEMLGTASVEFASRPLPDPVHFPYSRPTWGQKLKAKLLRRPEPGGWKHDFRVTREGTIPIKDVDGSFFREVYKMATGRYPPKPWVPWWAEAIGWVLALWALVDAVRRG